MYYLLVAVHVIVSIFLIIVVLLQSGKSADIAGMFGGLGSQTAFGPRGAATVLSKATTWSAVIFMVTSLSLAIWVYHRPSSSSILRNLKATPTSTTQPAKPPVQKTPQPEPQPLNPR